MSMVAGGDKKEQAMAYPVRMTYAADEGSPPRESRVRLKAVEAEPETSLEQPERPEEICHALGLFDALELAT